MGSAPPARRLTTSSPRSAHGWPEGICRTGAPSTPSCGRGSCSRSRHVGWRAGEDIDALPRLDPVTGAANRATCLAMRPDRAAKEAAWAVAISPGEPARLALAYAADVWVPGQEELMTDYRDRYFTEALPALAPENCPGQSHDWAACSSRSRSFPRKPSRAATAAQPPDNVLRLAVAEQATIIADAAGRELFSQGARMDGLRYVPLRDPASTGHQESVDAPSVAKDDADPMIVTRRKAMRAVR